MVMPRSVGSVGWPMTTMEHAWGGGGKSGGLKKGFAKVGRYPQATTYDTAWGVVIPAEVGSAPSNPLEGSGE